MGYAELFLTALGLSMDAFSAAVCRGTVLKKRVLFTGAVTALFFGSAQAIMPVIGYLLGNTFISQLERFDHWIAFVLLVLIGIKMIIEANFGDEEENVDELSIGQLFLLAIATSIDAMAVGLLFSAQGTAPLFPSAVIGTVTFVISFAGVIIGSKFGSKFGRGAESAGGGVLILIGLKLLIDGII